VKEEHDYQDLGVTKAQLDPKAKAGTFRAVPSVSNAMAATVSTGGPDEDALLALGNKMYTTFDTLKLNDILAYVSDDTSMTDFTMPAPIKGTKGMKAWFGTILKAFPDVHQMPLTNQWAIGTYLVTEGVMQGTQKGALGPIPATKKPIAMHFLDIVPMNNGKMGAGETYSNSVELLTQLGVIKPADAGAKPKQ
jgi:hypothetical protein